MTYAQVLPIFLGIALAAGAFDALTTASSLGAEGTDRKSEGFLTEPTPISDSLYQPRSLAPPRQQHEVEVQALNGESTLGLLGELDLQGVTVSPQTPSATGRARPERFKAESLPLVRFRDEATGRLIESPPIFRGGRVWFRGGSTLPIRDLRTLDDGLSVEIVAAGEAWPRPLVVSIDALKSVRFPVASNGREADWQPNDFGRQWRALQARKSTADAIVTPRRDAGGLDYVEGFVEAVGADSIQLYLENQPVDAPRARIYGIVFASDSADVSLASAEHAPLGPRVTTLDGFVLNAQDLRAVDERALFVQTLDGLELTVPLNRVGRIDYGYGRVLDLGDLPPMRVEYAPLFGLPRGLRGEAKQADAAFCVDRSFWGRSLTLRDPDAVAIGRRRYDRGLALRSGAEIVYRVPPGVRRFDAVVGVDPNAVGRRRLRLVVEDADGNSEPLFRGTLAHDDPPRSITASLVEVNALRLRVERVFGADGTLHLGDARLIR